MSERPGVRVSELRMESVGKRCGASWAVKDVSLSVRPGELYTLLGPSGSGKTTLLRLIAGLVTPDAGSIVIDDEPIDSVPPGERSLGMVFQGRALWPHLSVFDNVAFGPRARGGPEAEIARRVGAALDLVGLGGAGRERPSRLSDAESLRVAIARAIVVEPRLLLLDDPLTHLGPAARGEMRAELLRLHRDHAITTICATPDQADALALSTRIAVLSTGSVAQEGRPEEIYWQPQSRVVAALVGDANLVPVRVVELRDVGVVVETAGGARVPVPSGGRVWKIGARGLLCLRPEALRVEEAVLAPGGMSGKVVSQAFEGSRQRYEVDISGATLRVEMLTSVLQSRSLKPGDAVKVEILPETSVLLPDDGDAPASTDAMEPPRRSSMLSLSPQEDRRHAR